MKKAQGLSMTTIVIAALALLVLVVLVLIFTGRLNLWGQGVDQAQGCVNFCNGLNQEARTDLMNDDSGKATCRDAKPTGLGGSVIPGTTGDTKDHICCCYKLVGSGVTP
jgi:hypothetical protein